MTKHPKDRLYEELARIGRAFAAPRRLELLDLLAQAPRTVEDLAGLCRTSVANTSQHLQVLRAAGLVASEKEGLFVTYRLATKEVATFSLQLQSLAESRLAEMDRVKQELFTSAADLEPVDGKELLARVRRGEVLLLDVRPAEEYAAGHLAGAISIPHDEVKRRLAELPRGRAIVAYCRGPYCVFAGEVVKLLRRRGFEATRIETGVAAWQARGLPVELGASAALR